ncbi:hypothetical protein Mal15_14070 [Stieleria maiorica]|uniref:Uncharacterized protein n=1 Tax=Stieleria maiorica TaxID=2795974 RepID=A0A5B9MDN6_9BACT|nr:hypothetical protein Mal15_14070 [Stieleria maiorica]
MAEDGIGVISERYESDLHLVRRVIGWPNLDHILAKHLFQIIEDNSLSTGTVAKVVA